MAIWHAEKRQAGRGRKPGQPRRQAPDWSDSRCPATGPGAASRADSPPSRESARAGPAPLRRDALGTGRAPLLRHERAQQRREEAPEHDLPAQPGRREVHDGARRLERVGKMEERREQRPSTTGAGPAVLRRGVVTARHRTSRAAGLAPVPAEVCPRRLPPGRRAPQHLQREERPHRRLRQDREDHERPVARLHAGARVKSPWRKRCIRAAMHPAWTALLLGRICPSSLVAPCHSRCHAAFHHGLRSGRA